MYRVDVVFEGALEDSYHYSDQEEAEQVHQRLVSRYAGIKPGGDWQVDLYDENPYPPEPLLEVRGKEVS